MKFSGKTCLMIILKVTKKQGFTLFSRKCSFENNTGRSQIEKLVKISFTDERVVVKKNTK